MKILIIGINSQDGFYTFKKFINKSNYEIYGTKRLIKPEDKRIFFKAKLIKENNLFSLLEKKNFKIIFNFSAINTLSKSEKNSNETLEINGTRVFKILNSLKDKKTKFFQAGSIEQDFFKNKKINFSQSSTPYSLSKQFSHLCVKYFRAKHNIFAVNAILYNHDSVRRRNDFFMKKFSVNIKKWKRTKTPFEVYNIDSYKDWSHSKDFVDCYYKIINFKKPFDWVIGSGKKNTVGKVCELFLNQANIKYYKNITKKKTDYYETNSKKKIFVGYKNNQKFYHDKRSIKKTQKLLNWAPKIKLQQIVKEIYEK
tara:strand:+ start:1899 stop:2831 length:933 start_codon:yes stop_codon:yes gene_type:complete